MSEFFAMGGYAAFVWPAYGLAALVLAGLLVATLKGLRASETTLKALEGSRPPRRRRRDRGDAPNHPPESPVNTTTAEVGEG